MKLSDDDVKAYAYAAWSDLIVVKQYLDSSSKNDQAFAQNKLELAMRFVDCIVKDISINEHPENPVNKL